MLNYSLILCQIKKLLRTLRRSFCFLFFTQCLSWYLVSCSTFNRSVGGGGLHLNASKKAAPEALWFQGDNRFARLNENGDVSLHPFFDLEGDFNKEEGTVNFFPLSPAGSEVAYQLDLLSGMNYRQHFYCRSADVWEHYQGKLSVPSYTEGVIPRVLDQLGKPQKIIVFGRDEYYQKFKLAKTERVRVIGGLIEQNCQRAPCLGGENWNSRLVLVAVDLLDKKFADVSSIAHLKKLLDWDYVVAFFRNTSGAVEINYQTFPVTRVLGEIAANKALVASMEKSQVLSFKEVNSLKNNCHRLYDHIWEDWGEKKAVQLPQVHSLLVKIKQNKKIQAFEKDEFLLNHPFKTLKKEKINPLEKNKLINLKKLEDELEKSFSPSLVKFFQKFGQQYEVCSRFVTSSNINDDYQRHWFFTYLDLFFKFYKMGYVYDCGSNIWRERVVNQLNGDYLQALPLLRLCSGRDLDLAFHSMTKQLMKLKQDNQKYYRYIEYDDVAGGTHQKIYSWVPDDSEKILCDLPQKKNLNRIREIFPPDIRWGQTRSK